MGHKNIFASDGCLAQLVFFVFVLICLFSYPPYGLLLGIGILFIRFQLHKKKKLEKQKIELEQVQKEMDEEEKINKRFDEMDKKLSLDV